jgi:hypothetical protein
MKRVSLGYCSIFVALNNFRIILETGHFHMGKAGEIKLFESLKEFKFSRESEISEFH